MDDDDDDDDDFGGLARDLARFEDAISRRRMFGVMAKAAAGLALAPILVGCHDPDVGPDPGTDPDATGGACSKIPSETAGPFPGNGTNGANILTEIGVNRSDIRTSIGTASGTAEGIELAVTIALIDAATCQPLVGYAIYVWQCDRSSAYSMYAGAASTENYLRGVQVTDATGQVTFTTIFPACYAGRWPHLHFEMYASLAAATNGNARVAVSQLALPKAACDQVYATTGYEASIANLGGVSLASDTVFRDGSTLQIATISGAIGNAFAASLTVAI